MFFMVESGVDSLLKRRLSRREFLKVAGVLGLSLSSVSAALVFDQERFGGALAFALRESLAPKEKPLVPRLIEPIFFFGSEDDWYDPKLALERVDSLVSGAQAFYKRVAGFNFDLKQTRTLELSGKQSKIFELPSTWGRVFNKAACAMVKDKGRHEYGGTICIFCPSFYRVSRKSDKVGGRVDGVGAESYVFAYQSLIKDFITPGATFEDLYSTARMLIHEFGHSFGLSHPPGEADSGLAIMGTSYHLTPRYEDLKGRGYKSLKRRLDDSRITRFVADLDITGLDSELKHLRSLYD